MPKYYGLMGTTNARQKHGKFITPQALNRTGHLLHFIGKTRPNQLQQMIPYIVSQGIVYLFESIQIDK